MKPRTLKFMPPSIPIPPLAERVACLKSLKRLGFETGSGFMIGLPNQTAETLADDLLLLQEIGCDMAGMGPFYPLIPARLSGTYPAAASEMTKRAVALARILLPS